VPSLRERANRRERAIEQFRERQRVVRHWISLSDLVNSCTAMSTTVGITEQEKARDLALGSLAASIRAGEFEGEQRRGNDGSQILFVAPYVPGDDAPPRCRLTREQFEHYMRPALPCHRQCWRSYGCRATWRGTGWRHTDTDGPHTSISLCQTTAPMHLKLQNIARRLGRSHSGRLPLRPRSSG
jgi:hypothetical protein